MLKKFLGSFYQKIKITLSIKLKKLFSKPISEETLDELEQILYESDLGSTCAIECTERLKEFYYSNKGAGSEAYIAEMKAYADEILSKEPMKETFIGSPHVILIVGINGAGKTTSIAKLAKLHKDKGKKVLVAAADTFRAAAVEQLTTWAEKIGVDIVKGKTGGDPSSVVYDAISKGRSGGYDIVIIDTAGRLETKTELMHELEKISRVSKKLDEGAPHETYLVVDATIGQVAIEQASIFNKYTKLTGLILTKLDGSAKGGIILSIYRNLQTPVKYVGLGEGMDDLKPFDKKAYLDELFSSP